jgi:predicted ATPase/class 3 adenylate cyclase
MTDLEGSAAKWERHPDAMREAMARHDVIAAEVVTRNGGALVKLRGEGDSLFVVFPSPLDALHAASEIQRRFREEPWPEGLTLATRIGVHCGEVHVQDRDYYGPTVNRCARLRGIGHGGQTLVTKAVHAQVSSRMPAGMRLRDLGTHRLRDLQVPERVYQLETGGPRAFPPLRSLDARPNNLPLQLTSFVAREEEIQSIQQALRISRLVTLVGPGGSGKTRLAIQVGAEHNDPFPDGVWFVELAPHFTEDEIGRAIARAVQGDPRMKDPLAVLEGIPEALLVLDNAEHAVSEVARTVATALVRVTKLRILVTSREPLRVAGEAVVRVDPLPMPEAHASLDAIARSPSVRLFVERAAAKTSGFTLNEANGADVARICRRLDGIPLAVEQAASMVPYLSPGEIADRLTETFDLLESDEEGVVPRHRTLEATIDWSHSLLTPAEQALFRRLSVFGGSFTLGAVEAVCSDKSLPTRGMLKLMRALVDKSLLVRSSSAKGAEVRHRMLAAVAEYAGNRLADETPALETRLFQWACDLVRKASANPYGTGDPTWSARLEHDHPNLRKAIEIGLAQDHPDVYDLVFGLRHFWLGKGHIAMARRFVERILASAMVLTSDQRAQLLNTLGAFAWRANELGVAQECYEESLAIRCSLGDTAGSASVLNNLGILASDRGDHERAISLYDQALTLASEAENPTVHRLTLANRSMSLLDLQRIEESEVDMRRALRLSEEAADRTRVALLHASLADIDLRRERPVEAATQLDAAFAIWEESADLFTMAEALLDVAQIALMDGQPEVASRCVRHFLGILRTTETAAKIRAQTKLTTLREQLLPFAPLTPIAAPPDLIPSTRALLAGLKGHLREPLLTPPVRIDRL